LSSALPVEWDGEDAGGGDSGVKGALVAPVVEVPAEPPDEAVPAKGDRLPRVARGDALAVLGDRAWLGEVAAGCGDSGGGFAASGAFAASGRPTSDMRRNAAANSDSTAGAAAWLAGLEAADDACEGLVLATGCLADRGLRSPAQLISCRGLFCGRGLRTTEAAAGSSASTAVSINASGRAGLGLAGWLEAPLAFSTFADPDAEADGPSAEGSPDGSRSGGPDKSAGKIMEPGEPWASGDTMGGAALPSDGTTSCGDEPTLCAPLAGECDGLSSAGLAGELSGVASLDGWCDLALESLLGWGRGGPPLAAGTAGKWGLLSRLWGWGGLDRAPPRAPCPGLGRPGGTMHGKWLEPTLSISCSEGASLKQAFSSSSRSSCRGVGLWLCRLFSLPAG